MQAEKKPKGKYWIIGGPVLIAIVIVVLAGCRPRLGQATAVPSSGTTVTAFLGNLSASSTASGQVTPRREASLSVQAPGRVEQVNVRVGDSVQAGDTLVQLETAGLALNVATAELNLRLKETNLAALREAPSAAEIAAAEASVASAQANLDDLAAGSTEAEIAASEANLRASQASLWSASAELGSVQNSIEPSQIQAAQAALLSAQISQRNAREVNQADPTQETHDAMLEADRAVAQAQAQLDTLLAGPDAGTLGGAQGSVASAAARVDSSQANLGAQLAGPTTAQVAAAESATAASAPRSA